MTSLAAGSSIAAPAKSPPANAAFGLRIFTGLVGVLLAVLVSGFNENVTKVAMPDIRGAMGIGYDDSTWLLAVHSATSISATPGARSRRSTTGDSGAVTSTMASR